MRDRVDKAAKRRFLDEYEGLVKKHGLMIESCGCCQSPWVVTVGDDPYGRPPEKHIADHLTSLRSYDP